MSRKLFEYFFDSEELEPFYSELPAAAIKVQFSSDYAQQELAESTETIPETEATSDSVVEPEELRKQPFKRSPDPEDTQSDTVTNDSASSPTPRRKQEPQRRFRVRQLLSVHALGQYVFCVRSAIMAAERDDEVDIDEPLPRLTYLPNFDRERIEEMLSAKLRQLGVSLLYAASMLILIVVGVLDQNRILFYSTFFLFLGYLVWLAGLIADILQLAVRRHAALSAEARQPDPQVTGIQTVNWWSMLQAGFEPVNYQRPFRHPELPLEGCPWRGLERGSQRIPVIRSGGAKLGDRKGELYQKHQIRLAAYALLWESMGHMEVPYGLVFPADSPRGLALPITPALREQAVHLLEEFALKLHESQTHQIEPRPPENRKRCEKCPHGVPVAISPGEHESARQAGSLLLILQSANGNTFHCECGDRFGSAPPHGQSLKLGLTATLD